MQVKPRVLDNPKCSNSAEIGLLTTEPPTFQPPDPEVWCDVSRNEIGNPKNQVHEKEGQDIR